MVAGAFNVLRHAHIQSLAVVANWGGLSMDNLPSIRHGAPIHLKHTLLPETDTQNGDLASECSDYIHGDTSISRVSWAWGDDNVAGFEGNDIIHCHFVVTVDDYISAKVGKVLVHIPGETVVIVDKNCSHVAVDMLN
jgi:hypothetical protein